MNCEILIADDERDVRDILRRMLEGIGCNVSLAADGREALRQLREREFDLVISDMLMPEVDGLELILYLRREKPDVKIVAMSGGCNELYLTSARQLGAMRIIEKPFTMQEVITTVSGLLEHRRGAAAVH